MKEEKIEIEKSKTIPLIEVTGPSSKAQKLDIVSPYKGKDALKYPNILLKNLNILKNFDESTVVDIDSFRKCLRFSYFNVFLVDKLQALNDSFPTNKKMLIPTNIRLCLRMVIEEELESVGLGFLERISRFIIQYLKDREYLFMECSPEAYLRLFIWDSILNELFIAKGMHCGPEYNADNMLKIKGIGIPKGFKFMNTRHRLDYTSFMKLGSYEYIPIFLCEISPELIKTCHNPKDYSKLAFHMSNALLFLVGIFSKRPGEFIKSLRVYGAHIFGSSIQFCVCFPLVTIDNGMITNLSVMFKTSNENWRFDLFDRTSISSKDTFSKSLFFCSDWVNDVETLFDIGSNGNGDGDGDVSNSIGEFDLSCTDDDGDADADADEEKNVNLPNHTEYNIKMSYETLWAIKEVIDHVASLKEDFEREYRALELLPGNNIGKPIIYADFLKPAIPKRRGSKESDIRHELGRFEPMNVTSKQKSADGLYIISKKYCQTEFDLYSNPTTTLTKNDITRFPYIRKAILLPNTKIAKYEMEFLGDMFDYSNKSQVGDNRLREHFLQSMKFLLDALSSLHYLHCKGYIHSDVSGTNIGLSYIHGTWKLYDFDKSLRIEQSLKTVRISGTEDFIHPSIDSETGGIFKPFMDIYSLLKVFDYAWLHRFRVANLYKFFVEGEKMTKDMKTLYDFVRSSIKDLVDCGDCGKTTIKYLIGGVLPLYKDELIRSGRVFDITSFNARMVLDLVGDGDGDHSSSIETVAIAMSA